MSPPVLIVAYGNPLRCDDGIGWRAAHTLQGKLPESKLEIRWLHQLAPEIAESVRNRQLVIFLDAACGEGNCCAGEIRVRVVSSNEVHQQREGQFSHIYSPTKIIALARELYGAAPKAFVVTVTGENFAHGNDLSSPVASALPELLEIIRRMIEAV